MGHKGGGGFSSRVGADHAAGSVQVDETLKNLSFWVLALPSTAVGLSRSSDVASRQWAVRSSRVAASILSKITKHWQSRPDQTRLKQTKKPVVDQPTGSGGGGVMRLH
jgi:hypothetical protein